MILSTRSPDKHAYLVDTNNSRTRKVIKISGSLLAMITLFALGIWTFTPVSEEANYKPVQAKNTIPKIHAPKQAAQLTARPAPPAITLAEDATASIDAPTGPYVGQATVTKAPLLSAGSPGPAALEYNNVPLTLETFRLELADVITSYPGTYADRVNFHAGTTSSAVTPRLVSSIEPGRLETISIKSGDTLTRIFSSANISISQAIKLSQNKAAEQLNRLSIGNTLRIYFDENNQWETLEYDTNKLNTLIVSPDEGEFIISQYEKQVEYRTYTAHGVIESTLGLATESAGVSAGITQKLVDIYQWEIDFARNIYTGDSFSVVYQKAYIDDELVADGDILAASFTSGGRSIDAIRYTDSLGQTAYFQPDGASLRRGFLRTPVRLARITSGFGKRRHPIKKTWKKHLGVDYGASRGTPILATADGVVQYSGKKGGYGNAVILRHGGIYTTLYAHMSKLGKGVRSGKAVTQGQVIGYVGRSGWATGDHLHYEFRINGQHKDPLKVKLPKTLPLAKKEMPTFVDQAEPLLGTLTSLKAAQLAILDAQVNQATL